MKKTCDVGRLEAKGRGICLKDLVIPRQGAPYKNRPGVTIWGRTEGVFHSSLGRRNPGSAMLARHGLVSFCRRNHLLLPTLGALADKAQNHLHERLKDHRHECLQLQREKAQGWETHGSHDLSGSHSAKKASNSPGGFIQTSASVGRHCSLTSTPTPFPLIALKASSSVRSSPR